MAGQGDLPMGGPLGAESIQGIADDFPGGTLGGAFMTGASGGRHGLLSGA
jgi:hypothetical protein